MTNKILIDSYNDGHGAVYWSIITILIIAVLAFCKWGPQLF